MYTRKSAIIGYDTFIIPGLRKIVMETIKNVNVYGFPQINPIGYLKISSSLFLDGKPDIIIKIGKLYI